MKSKAPICFIKHVFIFFLSAYTLSSCDQKDSKGDPIPSSEVGTLTGYIHLYLSAPRDYSKGRVDHHFPLIIENEGEY